MLDITHIITWVVYVSRIRENYLIPVKEEGGTYDDV